jgi:tetratricopeptide (TPR) repeat protein
MIIWGVILLVLALAGGYNVAKNYPYETFWEAEERLRESMRTKELDQALNAAHEEREMVKHWPLKDDPFVVSVAYHDLGKVLLARKESAEAEIQLAQALALREPQVGSQSPQLINILNDLAKAHYDQRHYAQAEPIFRRVLSLMEAKHGKDDPKVSRALFWVVHVLFLQKQFPAAEPFNTRLMKMREAENHPDLEDCVYWQGIILVGQKKVKEAEPVLQRTLAYREKKFGAESLEVAEVAFLLSSVYQAQNHFEKCDPLLQRALAIRKKLQGDNHPDLFAVLGNLGKSLVTQEKDQEARPILEAAVKIGEKEFSQNPSGMADPLNQLGLLHLRGGELDLAKKALSRGLGVQKNDPDSNPVEYINSLFLIGEYYRLSQNKPKAKEYYLKALKFGEKNLGKGAPDLDGVYETLKFLDKE